jgi:acetyl-CoA synthetase
MAKLTDYTRYADAQQHFSQAGLWDLFDGGREWLNIGHECIDRHAGGERIAVRIAHADGGDEALAFRDLAASSSQFAHYLVDRGVKVGDRVAIMLEPSLAFYVALFGTAKLGAIAVPLFMLFGPDAIRLRIDDCTPRLLIIAPGKADLAAGILGLLVVTADDDFMAALVIISAGWTTSAVEVEDALLKHADVREVAVIGAFDKLRGQVVKAFIVSPRTGDETFARELQTFTRTRLSQHE